MIYGVNLLASQRAMLPGSDGFWALFFLCLGVEGLGGGWRSIGAQPLMLLEKILYVHEAKPCEAKGFTP